jgi:histone deacetylase 6
VQSSSNTLDEMLDEHREEVQDLLLSRRNTELEDEDTSSPTDDGQQAPTSNGLRSPFRATFATPSARQGSVRQGSATGSLQSPKMPGGAAGPPVGLFHVGSPKVGSSPRSPMKRGM